MAPSNIHSTSGPTNGAIDEHNVSVYSEQLELLSQEVLKIQSLVEAGEEPNRIYASIVQSATKIPYIISSAIYLPADVKDGPNESELVAQCGAVSIPEPGQTSIEKEARIIVHGTTRSYQENLESSNHYTDIVCLGAPIGSLGVAVTRQLATYETDFLLRLACFAGIIFERQRLSIRLRHFVDRLEVLNELNQLIASGISLERISRSLAREAAFRFAADCSLIMLIGDSEEELQIHGSYGCAPDILPSSISVQNTILGRSLRLGGMTSIPELSKQKDYGLSFLPELWINCIHCASLEVHGETLGVILIGFRKSMPLSDRESSMFEELAQGAAVAIANARSRKRLSTYAEKLEELVEQRTSDLAIQTSKAEDANKAKSRFVANISHELRTPLTAIVGYASVLSDGVFGAVTDKQKDALSSITRSSEHLKELIDDVLNISRIESGKEDPKPSQVDLCPLVSQIFKLMLQTAIGKGVTLVPIEFDESLKSVKLWMDSRHIRQILINLLSNAIKYTEPGGSVSLQTDIIGDKVRIGICDTGVGLTPAQLKTLFQRFERSNDSYSQKQSGTGIGLSLTKHLAEINGGQIRVESKPKVGSTFWVYAPLVDAASVVDPETSIEADIIESQTSLSGLNILVVDDNEMTCDMLGTILSKAEGIPHIANSVAAAKSLADKINFDAALIDLAMPGESGLDLITFFRQHCEPPLSTMPLIVVSACALEEDRNQAMTHGASFFISKPFRPREIIKTVRLLTTSSALNSSGIHMT